MLVCRGRRVAGQELARRRAHARHARLCTPRARVGRPVSDERLSRLAGRVADGEEIDWAQAEAEAPAPGDKDEVLGLRTLALLAAAMGNTPAAASGAPRTWGPLRLRERI